MAFDGTLKFDTSIDQSGFDSGLENLGGMAEKALSAVAGLAQNAVSGIWSLGQQAIETGKQFTSSMSQVGATLGYSVAELNNPASEAAKNIEMLTAKAKEMGAATSFSASAAADGLNVLAMSGYSAQESVDMINSVLNTAAAGNIALDAAASYIAGSMKGFTKEAKNFADNAEASAYYADMIAKGATLANTNVQQLGEALSQASSSADSYGQSARETEVALLRLAEQNTVGSAAATALAAGMKELYTPSAQAKQILDDLGVSAYDATTGAAKGFNQVVDELGAALRQIEDESQRNALESAIFGEQGKRAFDQMLASSSDKVQGFYDSLDYTESGAKGSAALQAESMMDNLAGDITVLGSAFEGFQIALSENFDAPLREAVQQATEYISELTEVLNEEGLDGLADSLGEKVSDAIVFLSGYIPDIAETGSKVALSLVSGFEQNIDGISANLMKGLTTAVKGTAKIIPAFSKAGVKLILSLASGILKGLPELSVTALEILDETVSGLDDNLPELLSMGESALNQFADTMQKKSPRFRRLGREILKTITKSVSENMPLLTETALKLVDSFVTDLSETSMLADVGTAAVSLLLALADGLIGSVSVLAEKAPEIVTHLMQAVKDNADLIKDSAKTILSKLGENLKNAKEDFKENAPEIMQNLIEALASVPLAVGAVADALISAIAESLGLGDKWEEVKSTVAEQLEKLQFKLGIDVEDIPVNIKESFDKFKETVQGIKDTFSKIINGSEDSGSIAENIAPDVDALKQTTSEAFDRIKDAVEKLAGAFALLETPMNHVKEIFGEFKDKFDEFADSGEFTKFLSNEFSKNIEALAVTIDAVSKVISIAVTGIEGSLKAIALADAVATKIVGVFKKDEPGTAENGSVGGGHQRNPENQSADFSKWEQEFQAMAQSTKEDYINPMLADSNTWGKDFSQNFADGISDNSDKVINALDAMNQRIYRKNHFSTPDEGALKDADTWMPDMMKLFASGIAENTPLVTDKIKALSEKIKAVFSENIGSSHSWGADLISNFISGLGSMFGELENMIDNIGLLIYERLHHSTPDKGYLKDDNIWFSDMMQNFADGIRQNAPQVLAQADGLTEQLKSAFEIPESVMQAFRYQNMITPAVPAGLGAVSEIINNQYAYHTINQTVQNPETKPADINMTAYLEVDGQVIGTAVKKVILDENAGSGGWFL